MFGYKKKIIAILMAVLIVLVSLVSASFSTKVAKVSSSFACTTSVARSTSKAEIVETVANIEVEGLTADIITGIEDNLKSSTEGIYEAKQTAIAEARAIERAKTQEAKAQSEATNISSGANLNGLEAQMLNLINSARAQNGLGQLTVVQSLTDIARTRCSDMVSRGYFSHYTPEGTTFFNIMRNCGISWSNAGENLGNSTPANYGTPDAFINAWMNSPSHRDNMLRSHYKYIGVGIIDGGGRRVVTTIFLN